MINAEVKRDIEELIQAAASTLRLTCERLYSSEALDLGPYNQNSFPLAKVLLTAALREHVNDFAPLRDPELMEDIETLANF